MSKLKFKPLGILYYKNKIVNHRSILKVFLNPVLMIFGTMLASSFDDDDKFLKYVFIKCKPHFNVIKNFSSHFFTCNDYDRVEKKKIVI
ncbi:MAG: hypothetical protein PHF86_02950 [Candidatus Nanoarchaeia archaeon]|jgi:hypothetical protein|nr:hypothetical protein [Candidatus Nanoarchaeia archaeon]